MCCTLLKESRLCLFYGNCQLNALRNPHVRVHRQKTREMLDALDTIRRRLQFDGIDMDPFFRVEKQLQNRMQKNI